MPSMLQVRSGVGKLFDIKNRWVRFNGNVPHGVKKFEGTRISIVFFTRNGTEEHMTWINSGRSRELKAEKTQRQEELRALKAEQQIAALRREEGAMLEAAVESLKFPRVRRQYIQEQTAADPASSHTQ